MERPRTSTIDITLGRELATRNGIKAIVDGNLTGVAGGGYLVRLRLVTADSLKELASFLEPADDTRGLIDAVDKLGRALRGKIGESLKSVNAATRLAQVTTSSFEALSKYTAGDRAEVDGQRSRAIALLREAVAIDSTFAEAWRRLAIVQQNAGRPREVIDSAYLAAYRHRHRTSPKERAFIEASYFSSPGPNRDRAKGIAAYEEMMRYGDSSRAANNLGLRVANRQQFARAESLYRISIRLNPDLQRISVPNLISSLIFQQKFAEVDSVLAIANPRFRTNGIVRRAHVTTLYMKGDLPGYRRAVDSVLTRGDSLDQTWAKFRTAELALLDGRVKDFMRLWREGNPPNDDPEERLGAAVSMQAWVRIDFLNQAAAVMREVEAAIVAAGPAASPDQDWPYFDIIDLFAAGAKQPQRARAWLNRYDAEVKDTFRLRIEANSRLRSLSDVLVAEGKPLEAVDLVRRSYRLPDGPDGTCTSCVSWRLGDVFDEAKMADSAIFYMEQGLTVFDPARMGDFRDPFILPWFYKRLGELYEARGDRVKAVEYYRKHIELWKNADPELQVTVNDLKARVRRLTDLEGRPR